MNRATVFQVVGGVMALAGLIWGRTGFYSRDLPWLLLLTLGGAALIFVGIKMKDLQNKK